MSAMLSVQKGVPLPEINRASKGLRKYPIDTMAVGEMFFVPGRSSKSVSSYISRISKGVPGRFSARYCWMRPGLEHENCEWVLVSPDEEGAVEGTGVYVS